MIEAMFDNETWGIRTTSVVRSVGIVLFEGSDVLETHYFRIDESEQHCDRDVSHLNEFAGSAPFGFLEPRTCDRSTAEWWAKPENAEAQATIAQAPLITWDEARVVCGKVGQKAKNIWAKPAMFDLPMLRDLFGQDIWPYWKERDLSTLLGEYDPERSTKPVFKGIPHNALDDALHAHLWLCDFRAHMKHVRMKPKETQGLKIWDCKIGEIASESLAPDADWPMRMAVQRAYREVTGKDARFTFSGWNGCLTECERKVADHPGS